MKSFFKSSIITSLLLLVLGVLLIFQSEATISTISYVIGAVLICVGTLAFVRYIKTNRVGIELSELDILYGVITIIVGVLVIKNPHVIANIIPIILGIAIIISSTIKVQYAFDLKSANNDLWKTTLLIAVISTLCGAFLLFNPFAGAVFIMKVVGVFIFIYSILDLASTLIIKKNVSSFNSTVDEKVDEAEVVIKEEKETKTVSKEVKKAPIKKITAKEVSPKKEVTHKPASKTAEKKAPAKKVTAAKKTTATVKKTTTKKATTKTPAKKTTTKTATSKATTKKTAEKKATTKKTTTKAAKKEEK